MDDGMKRRQWLPWWGWITLTYWFPDPVELITFRIRVGWIFEFKIFGLGISISWRSKEERQQIKKQRNSEKRKN